MKDHKDLHALQDKRAYMYWVHFFFIQSFIDLINFRYIYIVTSNGIGYISYYVNLLGNNNNNIMGIGACMQTDTCIVISMQFR